MDPEPSTDGPARASAPETVERADRIGRGRSASQLLMSTLLRINLSPLRDSFNLVSEHDEELSL
jgi:hypothetical protein